MECTENTDVPKIVNENDRSEKYYIDLLSSLVVKPVIRKDFPDDEKFIPLEGYEKEYEVSDKGNVRKIDSNVLEEIYLPMKKSSKEFGPNGAYDFSKEKTQYIISSFGNVKNMKTQKLIKSKIFDGKKQVQLFKKNFFVRRLVAQTFLWQFKEEDTNIISHKNKDLLNCKTNNLVWSIQDDANENSRLGSSIANAIPVYKINNLGNRVLFPSIAEACKHILTLYNQPITPDDIKNMTSKISRVCMGIESTCQGFKWEYAKIKNKIIPIKGELWKILHEFPDTKFDIIAFSNHNRVYNLTKKVLLQTKKDSNGILKVILIDSNNKKHDNSVVSMVEYLFKLEWINYYDMSEYIEPLLEGESWDLLNTCDGFTFSNIKVSNYGRVANVLTQTLYSLDQYGLYTRVGISDVGGGDHKIAVHKLVATVFIHNPDPKKFEYVNHLSEKKDENTVFNLEWIDAQGNSAYSLGIPVYRTNLQTGQRDEFNSFAQASRETDVKRYLVACYARGSLEIDGYKWELVNKEDY